MSDTKRFYTSAKLGPKMETTPEGFLVCYDVPIGRLGVMLYGPGEMPATACGLGSDGLCRIERDADVVFDAESMKTLEGKSVVNEHPFNDVSPTNWKQLAKGTVFSPRRGEGVYDDLLLADLVIYDADTIEDVKAGKREVSAGYDAAYEKLAEGRGRQVKITYNHVALVSSGRCGSKCSIKDHAYKEKTDMAKTSVVAISGVWDKVRAALKTNDKKTIDEAIDEAEKKTKDEAEEKDGLEERVSKVEGMCYDHARKLKTHDENFEKIDDKLKESGDKVEDKKTVDKDEEDEAEKKDIDKSIKDEMPDDMVGDRAIKSRDSAMLVESFTETVSLAEIIAPGIRIPTLDAAHTPQTTMRNICGLRRKALQFGTMDAATNAIIEQVRGRTLDSATLLKMPCSDIRPLFLAVGAAKKIANGRTHDSRSGVHTNLVGSGGGLGTAKTPAEINALNAKVYGSK